MSCDEHNKWEACFADPLRGIAFFDGVTIEADAITNPRRDRVFPVMEDEQVLVCRQMRPILDRLVERAHADGMPPPLVLDVGTGSGVFAIYAAQHGCRAIGIDILPRAIRMAKHNASNPRNGVRLVDSRQQLDDADEAVVLFHQQDFLRFAEIEENNDAFDAVVINPPYNPTCPGMLPAVHADAGPDGFEKFEQWVRHIPHLIKPGGYCVGIQMTPVDPTGVTRAELTLKEAFGQNINIAHERVFRTADIEADGAPGDTGRQGPNDMNAREFLQWEYKSFIDAANEQDPDAPQTSRGDTIDTCQVVADYIETTARAVNKFAVVYFHLQTPGRPVDDLPGVVPFPTWDWDERIRMHRHIIENSETEGLLPAPSLFMEKAALAKISIDDEDRADASTDWNRSPLRVVDEWLSDRELLSPAAEPHFDLLMTGSGPWYELGTEDEIPELKGEVKFWVADGDGGARTDVDVLLRSLVAGFDAVENAIQRARVAPFLHPRYTGHDRPNDWQSVVHTEIGHEWEDQDDAYGPFDTLFIRNSFLNMLPTIELPEGNPSGHDDRVPGYLARPLFGIGVRRGTAKTYAKEVENRVAELRDAWVSQRPDDALPDFWRVDLAACTWATHHAVHEQVNRCLERHTLPKLEWSTILCLPLTLVQWRDERDSRRPVPKEFRGSVYLFGGGVGTWTPNHERALFDTLTMLWLLYNGKYNVQAQEYLLKEGGRRAAAEKLSDYARGAAHGFKNALILPPLLLTGRAERLRQFSELGRGARLTDDLITVMAGAELDMFVAQALLEQLNLQAQIFFWSMEHDRFVLEMQDQRQSSRWPDVEYATVLARSLFMALAVLFGTATDEICQLLRLSRLEMYDRARRCAQIMAHVGGTQASARASWPYEVGGDSDPSCSVLSDRFVEDLGQALAGVMNLRIRVDVDNSVACPARIGGVWRGLLEGALVELIQNALKNAVKAATTADATRDEPNCVIHIMTDPEGLTTVTISNLALGRDAKNVWAFADAQAEYRPAQGIRGLRQVEVLVSELGKMLCNEGSKERKRRFDLDRPKRPVDPIGDEELTEVIWGIIIGQDTGSGDSGTP